MFVFRMWADMSELWQYVCNILRANFLHNWQSIICDNEVLMSLATEMPSIFLQRDKEVFSTLKENLVSGLQRKVFSGGSSSLCVSNNTICVCSLHNFIY